MRVVWERSAGEGVTANEVVERLAGRREWSPRTVKTLLNRVLNEGALSAEARGKSYVYRAKVRREECVRSESRSFLSRVFGGAAGPALLHFVNEAKLTAEEVEELRRVLERKARKS